MKRKTRTAAAGHHKAAAQAAAPGEEEEKVDAARELPSNACELYTRVTKLKGLPAQSASASDQLIVTVPPGSTYRGRPVEQHAMFVKMWFNAFPSLKPKDLKAVATATEIAEWDDKPVVAAQRIHNSLLKQGNSLNHERDVLKEIVEPLADNGVTQHVVRLLADAQGCSFDAVSKLTIAGGGHAGALQRDRVRQSVVDEWELGLARNLRHVAFDIDDRPSLGPVPPAKATAQEVAFLALLKREAAKITYNMQVSELLPKGSVSLHDAADSVFRKKSVPKRSRMRWFAEVMFQLHTLMCVLSVVRLEHHDLHWSNVHIYKNTNREMVVYLYFGKLYAFVPDYLVKIFDWDHAGYRGDAVEIGEAELYDACDFNSRDARTVIIEATRLLPELAAEFGLDELDVMRSGSGAALERMWQHCVASGWFTPQATFRELRKRLRAAAAGGGGGEVRHVTLNVLTEATVDLDPAAMRKAHDDAARGLLARVEEEFHVLDRFKSHGDFGPATRPPAALRVRPWRVGDAFRSVAEFYLLDTRAKTLVPVPARDVLRAVGATEAEACADVNKLTALLEFLVTRELGSKKGALATFRRGYKALAEWLPFASRTATGKPIVYTLVNNYVPEETALVLRNDAPLPGFGLKAPFDAASLVGSDDKWRVGGLTYARVQAALAERHEQSGGAGESTEPRGRRGAAEDGKQEGVEEEEEEEEEEATSRDQRQARRAREHAARSASRRRRAAESLQRHEQSRRRRSEEGHARSRKKASMLRRVRLLAQEEADELARREESRRKRSASAHRRRAEQESADEKAADELAHRARLEQRAASSRRRRQSRKRQQQRREEQEAEEEKKKEASSQRRRRNEAARAEEQEAAEQRAREEAAQRRSLLELQDTEPEAVMPAEEEEEERKDSGIIRRSGERGSGGDHRRGRSQSRSRRERAQRPREPRERSTSRVAYRLRAPRTPREQKLYDRIKARNIHQVRVFIAHRFKPERAVRYMFDRTTGRPRTKRHMVAKLVEHNAISSLAKFRATGSRWVARTTELVDAHMPIAERTRQAAICAESGREARRLVRLRLRLLARKRAFPHFLIRPDGKLRASKWEVCRALRAALNDDE